MPVELTIVETTVELGQTNVEVVLTSASEPGPAGAGVPTGGTDGQVLTKTSATDYATAWEDPTGAGGGAPADADYLVGTANGTLSAEIVVGTAPGGELGGTWASPTVDATHSGSSHAAVQAAAEATAAAALSSHEGDTTSIHGIADTSALATDAEVSAAISALSTVYQPLDSDLTSIAALTTTIYGRALLALADEATLKSTLNLEAGTDYPAQTTFDDHSARHENGGGDEISVAGLSGELADAQPITVRKNTGADVGTRSRLNFIEGTNVTLTVTDDAGSDEVDVTITAASGGAAATDFSGSFMLMGA